MEDTPTGRGSDLPTTLDKFSNCSKSKNVNICCPAAAFGSQTWPLGNCSHVSFFRGQPNPCNDHVYNFHVLESLNLDLLSIRPGIQRGNKYIVKDMRQKQFLNFLA